MAEVNPFRGLDGHHEVRLWEIVCPLFKRAQNPDVRIGGLQPAEARPYRAFGAGQKPTCLKFIDGQGEF